LPWAQLTSLTLIDVFPEQCAPILQHRSNLVHCELELIEDFAGVIPDTSLLSLRSLALNGDSAETG
jgi:hypothetical protein